MAIISIEVQLGKCIRHNPRKNHVWPTPKTKHEISIKGPKQALYFIANARIS